MMMMMMINGIEHSLFINIPNYIIIDTYAHTHTYIYINWPRVVEGDQKALFSIAITLRCRGERYSFPWIVPLHAWRHQVPFFESLV